MSKPDSCPTLPSSHEKKGDLQVPDLSKPLRILLPLPETTLHISWAKYLAQPGSGDLKRTALLLGFSPQCTLASEVLFTELNFPVPIITPLPVCSFCEQLQETCENPISDTVPLLFPNHPRSQRSENEGKIPEAQLCLTLCCL